ncbi:MAG: response regulator [Patescibacteria group bacterium]
MKILIVDDEPAVLTMYSSALKDAGHEVITANSGAEAIGQAKQNKPDVILLDIIMPSLNGFDVLTELKNNSETRAIPVFLLTNLPETTSGEKAKQLGAAGYLVKAQIEPGELTRLIEQQVKQTKNT